MIGGDRPASDSPTVAVLIPTRGRPAMLARTVSALLTTREMDSTRIVIGIDTDDVDTIQDQVVQNMQADNGVVFTVAEREDTLGAKYIRCADAVEADVYVIWADDNFVITKGWDRKIAEAANLFDDGLGFVFFGKIAGVMQPGIAATKGICDLMGGIGETRHPYWFADTRIIEIGRMSDRIVDLGNAIEVKLQDELKGKSRGVRDLAFWGQLFDRTRPERKDVARKIIEAGDDQPYRKRQLLERLPAWERIFLQANSKCSDPVEAKKLEEFYSFDAEPDERYLRTKMRAEALLLEGVRQAA